MRTRATDVRQCSCPREVEGACKSNEGAHLHAAHGVHELPQALWIAVELPEEILALFRFVLLLARAQGRAELGPETVEPVVRHLQDAAEVTGFLLVQEEVRFRAVAVARFNKKA